MTKQSKHIKRITIPRTWPIPKKGLKYIIRPQVGKNTELCLPICVIFRDMLKLVETRNELKQVLSAKDIMLNNKVVKDVIQSVGLFDIISVPKIKKNYRLEVSTNKKLIISETSSKDSDQKPYKVIGKTMLKKGKIQLNLYEGINFIGNKEDIKKVKVNDTLLVDLKQNKIIKHIPLKQGSFAWIIKGKHIGNKGDITEVSNNFVIINAEGTKIKTTIENIYITN